MQTFQRSDIGTYCSQMNRTHCNRLEDWLTQYPGLTAFVLSVLMLAPFVPMGMDVTDPGFHLANQLMVGRIGLAYIVEQPYWWFSDVIGWWWLSVTEPMHLGLLGAHVGGILLFAASAAIAARIVSRHVLAHWLVPLSVLCVAPFFSSFLSLISYDSVPAFLCLVGLYLYLEAAFRYEQGWALCVWSFAAGGTFFLLLLARLPSLTVVVIPLCTVIAAAVIDKRHLRAAFMASSIVYSVMLVLSLVFYLYLLHSGLWARILAYQPLDTHYTTDFVFSVIKAQWSLVGQWVMWFGLPLVALFVALLLRSKRYVRKAFPVLVAFVLASYAWVSYRSQLQDILAGTLNHILFMSLLLCATVLAVVQVCQDHEAQSRSLLFRSIVITLAALALPTVVSAGSSAGIAKLQFGGYLIPPLAVALLILTGRLYGGMSQKALGFLGGAMTFLAFLFSLHHLYANGVFRDDPDRQRLTQSMNVPRLAGIRTTPERAQSIDTLYEALIARLTPPGATVLVYREAPLVHYLIDDLPFNNWIWVDTLPLSEIERGLQKMCDDVGAPYLVVRALEPTGNPIWGGKPHIESFAPPWQVEKYEAIDKAAATCGFQSVWKNVDFEILMRAGTH